MRESNWQVGVGLLTCVLASGPAMAFVNNGFETDFFYTPAKNNATKIHNESVRTGNPEVGSLGSHYFKSLTFAGTGTNDARLYGITPNTAWSNWFVVEVDDDGSQLKEISLAALAGRSSLGGLDLTTIRYNPKGNNGAGSLLIPVMDENVVAPLEVFELNLSLSQVLNVYSGPTIGGAKLGCDVDPVTGKIYVATGGEVVAFDTGVTGTYSTVVSSAQLGATPYGVIFRGAIGGLTQESLVVTQATGLAKEFDLNGNFIRNYSAIDGTEATLRYGQQDKITGDIVISSFGDNHFFLNTDNSVDNWSYGWWGNYFDAASPVPEPATLVLLATGLLCVGRRRGA